MQARKYNEIIKIYSVSVIPDGFGGAVASNESIIREFWAQVKQESVFKDTAQGHDISKINYVFNIRATKLLASDSKLFYIIYRGVKYYPKGLPKYTDALRREISITATADED